MALPHTERSVPFARIGTFNSARWDVDADCRTGAVSQGAFVARAFCRQRHAPRSSPRTAKDMEDVAFSIAGFVMVVGYSEGREPAARAMDSTSVDAPRHRALTLPAFILVARRPRAAA